MVRTVERSPGSQVIAGQESSDRPDRIALRCRQVTKSFGDQTTVDGLTFNISAGDILVLVGPSGCGKTTTLRLIAGFERLDKGSIEIAGQVVAQEGLHLPPEKRRVGMVFQDYAVFPHLSVGGNVGFALGKSEATRQRVTELLAFVGLPGQQNRMPHELSGGEQQRVSLARALSMEPAVLLLDEPFSNLDAALRAGMRAEVRALLKQSGITAVFVTHDQDEALLLGDTIAVIRAGRLEQIDTPEAIYHRPRSRFVAEFIGQTDFLPATAVSGGLETSLGFMARNHTLPNGAAVDIALRPEHVRLQPDHNGLGRVLSRQFSGMSYIYYVALPDGSVVRSRQVYPAQIAEDAMVNVDLDGDYDLPCFHHGIAL